MEIDPTHGWPTSGYRCNGCKKAPSKFLCAFRQCPVYINLEKLTPTITTQKAAQIIGVSSKTILNEIGNIEGAYMAGCWQIPKEAINKPPLSEIQGGKRRRP